MSAATLEEKKTIRRVESKASPKNAQTRRDRTQQRGADRPDKSRLKQSSARQSQPKKDKRQTHRIDPAEVERLKRIRQAAMRRKARARVAAKRAAEIEQDNAYRADDGWHFSIEKLFVYSSYVVAITLFVVFGLDLLTGMPFWRASLLFDVTNVVGGLTLAWLTWNTHRDLV
jgi:Flp pilus assembly protein TadB